MANRHGGQAPDHDANRWSLVESSNEEYSQRIVDDKAQARFRWQDCFRQHCHGQPHVRRPDDGRTSTRTNFPPRQNQAGVQRIQTNNCRGRTARKDFVKLSLRGPIVKS